MTTSIEWGAETHTGRPQATILPDRYVVVTFVDRGAIAMAMPAVVRYLGEAKAIVGIFQDQRSGVCWPLP